MAKRQKPASFRFSRNGQRPREIPPRDPSQPGPVESVEDFLARGGQIEQLDTGARGQPVMSTMREVNEASWRITKATKDEPETT